MKKITKQQITLTEEENEILSKTIDLIDSIKFEMSKNTELDPELRDYLDYICDTIEDILEND